ncbi:TPA: TIGR03758 family integrating conjugative element protein [Salmonella enterica]
MNHAQITAFSAGAGGIEPSVIKHLIVAIFFAFLFLWAAWALRTVYTGWSHQEVRGDLVGVFVIRMVILIELAIVFFSF